MNTSCIVCGNNGHNSRLCPSLHDPLNDGFYSGGGGNGGQHSHEDDDDEKLYYANLIRIFEHYFDFSILKTATCKSL